MNEDLNKKSAKLVMKLNADSGYSCTQEQEISVNQWKDINLVLSGKLKSTLEHKSEKIIDTEPCECCGNIKNIDKMSQDEEGYWTCYECLKTV